MHSLLKIVPIGLFMIVILACSVHQEKAEIVTFNRHIADKGNSRGVTVEPTNDGGYILTGYTTDGDFGDEDVLLIKTDPYGEVVWRKTYGGVGKDNGWAVRQTRDNGYIIVGFTNSFGQGDMDVYLLRTDRLGKTIWFKTFGGDGEEYGWDVRITNSEEFIIAAQTSSPEDDDIDALLLYVDTNGNEKWSKTIGGDQTDRIFSVQQTPDRGFVSAGITYSYSSVGPNDRDGYLIKTDSIGKLEWYKIFGEDRYDVVHSIDVTNDNGYILTGYGESYSTTDSRDVYLIKTDDQGKEEWRKVYGTENEERGIKGIQTVDGDYIIIGFAAGQRDVYLLKTNQSGDALWTKTFGSAGHVDFGYTVNESNDGGYILTGHSASLDGDSSNVLLIKTDRQGQINSN